MVCVVSSAMDLLKRQSSVFQLNGKLKAVILIGGPHVGEFILLNLLDVRVATIVIYGVTCTVWRWDYIIVLCFPASD